MRSQIYRRILPNGFYSMIQHRMKIFGFSVKDFSILHLLTSLILGRSTANFTATNQLFSSYRQYDLWRFTVTYTFASEQSSSALYFVINQPPRNGSCAITPLNGTTTTPFTISCPDWFDEDGIKSYSLYGMRI